MSQRELPMSPLTGRWLQGDELKRMASAVERATSIQGIDVTSGGWGYLQTDREDQWFWAQITAHDSSTPAKHSWAQVVPDGLGDWFTSDECPSFSYSDVPAYEANGGTVDVTDGPMRVVMWKGWSGTSSSDPFMWFYVPGGTPVLDTVYPPGATFTYEGGASTSYADGTYDTTFVSDPSFTYTGGASYTYLDAPAYFYYGPYSETYAALTQTYDATSSITYNGTILNYHAAIINYTDNVTETISNNKTLTITGGTGSSLNITVPTLTLNSATVNIGNSASWTWDSTTVALFQGLMIVCGPWYLCYDTPAAWSTRTDNYNPATWASVIRASTTSSQQLTGVMPRTTPAGRELVLEIQNVGSNPLVIRHQDANSTAANQFVCPGAVDLTLPAAGCAMLRYDPVISRWRVTGTTALTGSGTTDRVPVWTASGTLGDSPLYTDASFLSLGVNATPDTAYKLDVAGDARFRQNLFIGDVAADIWEFTYPTSGVLSLSYPYVSGHTLSVVFDDGNKRVAIDNPTHDTTLWINGAALSAAGISGFNESAQDAVGGILTDTATIDFTYDDAGNAITADVKNASITLAKITNAAASSKLVGSGASGSGASYSEITVGSNLTMTGTTLSATNTTYTADESTLHLSGTTFSVISTYVGQASIVTVGTLTGGATGAGFTIALTTSTVTGTLPAARLPAFGSGDVSFASGGGAGTIAAAAVTLAKIANAAANSKLVGSGASGSGASYSEITVGSGLTMTGTTLSAASSMSRGYIDGLQLLWVSTTSFGPLVGACRDSTNTTDMVLASGITKTTAAWAVGTATGGLDTGGIAASTWYYVWLIRRSDTAVVDVLYSTSATAPTMPTNYDSKRLIGAVLTDGSSHFLKFSQVGDEFLWDAAVLDQNNITVGTTASLLTLSVPPAVKVWAKFTFYASGTSGNYLILTSPDQADTAPVFNAAGGIELQDNSNFAINPWHDLRTVTAQIRARSAGGNMTGCYVRTHGWRDPRGRDA